jgi:hypothetical protein
LTAPYADPHPVFTARFLQRKARRSIAPPLQALTCRNVALLVRERKEVAMSSEVLQVAPSKPVSPARKRPVSAWAGFTRRLAAVLGKLQDRQYLILLVGDSNRYVQFAGGGEEGMRAEVVSNRFLPEGEQLDDAMLELLVRAGWNPPDPEGARTVHSPNHSRDFSAPVDVTGIARGAVRVLRDIFGVSSPDRLKYHAFPSGGGTLRFPLLGLEPHDSYQRRDPPKAGEAAPPLRDALLACVRETTKIAGLEYEKDGDLTVSYCGHSSHLRIVKDGRFVRIFALVGAGFDGEPATMSLVNELNRTVPRIQFWHQGFGIFADLDVPAQPFVSAHLGEALKEFCTTVHAVATDVASKLSKESANGPAGPPTLH